MLGDQGYKVFIIFFCQFFHFLLFLEIASAPLFIEWSLFLFCFTQNFAVQVQVRFY